MAPMNLKVAFTTLDATALGGGKDLGARLPKLCWQYLPGSESYPALRVGKNFFKFFCSTCSKTGKMRHYYGDRTSFNNTPQPRAQPFRLLLFAARACAPPNNQSLFIVTSYT